MFQLTKPSVKLWAWACVCVCVSASVHMCVFFMSPSFLMLQTNRTLQHDLTEDTVRHLYTWKCIVHTYMCSLCFIYNAVWTTKSSQRYVNLLSHCGGGRERGRWEWIRMATQVAQLLLKGLFITVRSLLAPSPLLSPSSVLTRPHLNNGPNTKKHVVCVEGVWGGRASRTFNFPLS